MKSSEQKEIDSSQIDQINCSRNFDKKMQAKKVSEMQQPKTLVCKLKNERNETCLNLKFFHSDLLSEHEMANRKR